MSWRVSVVLCPAFLFLHVSPVLKAATQVHCKVDSECPLLTNGHLNICIGRTHILRSGSFSVGFCADSNEFGDCSTDVDCVLLYRRKGLICSQAPGHPRRFKHCVQKFTNFGWIPCRTDEDCKKVASMSKSPRKQQVDVCLGRANSEKDGWCGNSKTSGKCKTDFDCRRRGKGSVCGRTPVGGYVCYYTSCKSPIICPTAE